MLFWLEKLIPDWSWRDHICWFSQKDDFVMDSKLSRFLCVQCLLFIFIVCWLSLTCWDLIDVTIVVEDANPKLDALIDVDLGV